MSDSNNWLEECYQSYREFCIDNEVFRKAAWTKADGDHTHCLFDAQKISNYDIDDNDKQGYCGDKGTWFCASCFEELIKRHNVKVEKNTISSIENALRRFSNVIISLNNEQYFLENKDGKITVEHNGVSKSYDSILSMEREQLFYGKVLREIIDDIFVGFVD